MAIQSTYPLIHKISHFGYLAAEVSTEDTTIFPLIFNDEGLEDPSVIRTHPENASFATVDYANCFPDSFIGRMRVKLSFRANPDVFRNALPTSFAADNVNSTLSGDELGAVKGRYMPIVTAFNEDLDAKDEKSTETIKSVLELQYETTDRQVTPLYVAGTDLISGSVFPNYAASPDTGVGQDGDMPSTDTNGIIEAVAFNDDTYYNMINYGTIGSLLRKLTPGGMKHVTLTKSKPFKDIFMNFTPSAAKRVNPYTFCGILVDCPQLTTDMHIQPFLAAEMNYSGTATVFASVEVYYQEWNRDFDSSKFTTAS